MIALILPACSSTTLDVDCSRRVEPVCGVVQPLFCTLETEACGAFRQTFRNACWAQQAEASNLTRGGCRPMGHGGIPILITRPEDAPQISFQTPIPPSGFSAVEEMNAERWEQELLSDTGLGLNMRGVRVHTRRVRQEKPEVVLTVSGRILDGCKRPDLMQSSRIEDTFYVELSSIDLRQLDLPCGRTKRFAKSLKLDPGFDPLEIGERYTVIVNGKEAPFLVRDKRRNDRSAKVRAQVR